MDYAESIVEVYCRCVKGWATIRGLRRLVSAGLVAIDPLDFSRYHIQTAFSVGSMNEVLTAEPLQADIMHQVPQVRHRMMRTIGYHLSRRFDDERIIEILSKFNLIPGNYRRVLVAWSWGPGVTEIAVQNNLLLWKAEQIIQKLSNRHHEYIQLFDDDLLKHIKLFRRALGINTNHHQPAQQPPNQTLIGGQVPLIFNLTEPNQPEEN